jgi:hypothetical protein
MTQALYAHMNNKKIKIFKNCEISVALPKLHMKSHLPRHGGTGL